MIQLVPMTQKDFEAFLERDIRAYAEENVKGGYWSEAEALEKSRKEHEGLLPEGLKTKNHYLYTIQDADHGNKVGIIWMRINADSPKPSGFIFDLEIDEPFRRKGYATQAMLRLEEVARRFGLQQLGLHVFAHNQTARALYDKLGYRVASLNMMKPLSSGTEGRSNG
jgi:ribosomal protein S18 acetylase RimI-like enzyme